MEIREFTEEISLEIFKVGNKEFKTLKKAEEYIEKVKEHEKKEYFLISYSPDLTEGRGYYKQMIVTTTSDLGINIVYEFLKKTLSSPISMVMGVAPMSTYDVHKLNPSNYDEAKRILNDTYYPLGRSSQKERLIIELGEINTPQMLDLVVAKNRDKI